MNVDLSVLYCVPWAKTVFPNILSHCSLVSETLPNVRTCHATRLFPCFGRLALLGGITMHISNHFCHICEVPPNLCEILLLAIWIKTLCDYFQRIHFSPDGRWLHRRNYKFTAVAAVAAVVVDFAVEKNKLRRHIGYCPQDDALLDLLTVRVRRLGGRTSTCCAQLCLDGSIAAPPCFFA